MKDAAMELVICYLFCYKAGTQIPGGVHETAFGEGMRSRESQCHSPCGKHRSSLQREAHDMRKSLCKSAHMILLLASPIQLGSLGTST